MRPADKIARRFLLVDGVHLCARGHCDCVASLTRVIEEARQDGARAERHRRERLRLAKPRIAEALAETRARTKRSA